MSLRRRLVFVLLLAVVALGAATFAIRQIFDATQVRRERQGLDAAESTARSLARALPNEPSIAGIRALLGATPDASAGTCRRDGELGPFANNGGWGEPSERPLSPELREGLAELCGPGGVLRLEHPHDVALLVVVASGGAAAAWSEVRVQSDVESRRGWLWLVALLGLATVVLSLVTVDAIRALRRGTQQLRDASVSLAQDLNAPVVRPRAEELGLVADGLREMAGRLAEAHARERMLERRLDHQERLAALGRVVAGVAHEVRNPLAGLKLRLDIARRSDGVPPKVLDEVRGSLDEVARLDRLVTSLLAMGRPTGSEASLDVGTLVDERLALMAATAATSGVTLERRGTSRATVDRDALARVLDNLLHNAVEAGAPHAVTVGITSENAHVAIAVRDRGPGVPVDAQLFEPFFTTKSDGTGLGLFIAQSLIQAMGGTIIYEREDPWTTFRVTLPASWTS